MVNFFVIKLLIGFSAIFNSNQSFNVMFSFSGTSSLSSTFFNAIFNFFQVNLVVIRTRFFLFASHSVLLDGFFDIIYTQCVKNLEIWQNMTLQITKCLLHSKNARSLFPYKSLILAIWLFGNARRKQPFFNHWTKQIAPSTKRSQSLA